ncbi:transglutaminase [Sphingobium sp. SCG-1]|uniref:transglutaminase-like domain-containing protein n=1 Tax=Sphingobium sp. SCG-1 TaxID=2072936 RepID=UPI000CD68ED0|nr:transglutaminase family protein [Sphingobium sp. SCG-1]AUW59192.1 transglutaminase [Sphingobium sp. SCG-1]
MLLQIEADLNYRFDMPTDILLAIEAADLPDQRIIEDRMIVRGAGPLSTIPGGNRVGRRTWTRTETGPFNANYRATIEVDRPPSTIIGLSASPLPQIPSDVVPFLWPSRYCEADRLYSFAQQEFGGLQGGNFAHAAAEWVRGHIRYVSGSSDGTTTAADTFLSRQGVCRDFAHLTAAIIRAHDIPARVASVYAWRLDPPDFHAVVEVWLDNAWHIVDATGLAPIEGMVRMAVGRDATDIAFLTAFGTATLDSQTITVTRAD